VSIRVVVTALGASVEDAIERCIAIEPMSPPEPEGARDVVIAVKSASVGWVDLIMAAGQYQHAAVPPYTPGLEYAGVVTWAGADAQVAVGERVLVDGFLAGPRSHGAYQKYGGFASYAVAPADAIHRIPGALTFDQACNLLGNYETAYHCLVARGQLRAGETVLIHGASGATGLAAVHVAKLLGATVIATGRSPEKLAVVAAQGADHTIGTSNLRDDVKALTAGRGVDVVYDGVGGEISATSLRSLRFGGRFLIVGWAATPGAINSLPTNLIMMKGLDVLGCPTVISTVKDPTLRPPRLAQILAWAAAGKITPHVSHTFPLTEIKAAMRAKFRGDVIGGCVVHPSH
jgi:NADPH2:quinone reductase